MRAYSIFLFNAGWFTHALMFKVSVHPTMVKEKIEQTHISAFPDNSEIQLTPFVMELEIFHDQNATLVRNDE